MKRLLFLLLAIGISLITEAQAPKNDDCVNATELPRINSYCSKAGEFSNQSGTPSSLVTPCFTPVQRDVWFKFVANKTDVNITVRGAIGVQGAGGTLRFPQVALYSGECGNTFEQICAAAKGSSHVVSVYKGGLVVGETYYVRVQGNGGQVGTFQLCVEQYNPPKEPTGDCPTSSILCDKSSFVVQSVEGFGNTQEVTSKDAPCFDNGGSSNIESNSTWFKWTCEKAGTLTFVLDPLRGEDDIDFVVFELPNGLNNCTGRKEVRCMASGETQGGCALLGPTGLRDGSTDLSEDSGCKAGKDNFIAPLQMEVGKSYAVMINNFTGTKSGFKMSFGGTGTFVGPQAAFSSNSPTRKVCFGEKITFTDNSKYIAGNIVKWEWDFGKGATPRTITDNSAGKQHDVVYNSPGKRFVILSIESDKGCRITAIDSFEVEQCCQTFNRLNFNTVVKNLQCKDILDGEIALNVTSNANPVTYKWDYGATTSTISGLGEGTYQVSITNAAKCDTVIDYKIIAPAPITADIALKRPTCNGGQDGSITLTPQGGVPPYTYDWGNGYVPINTLGNLAIGTYPVFIKDRGGCQKLINVILKEAELNLDPNIDAAKEPSCFGFNNGSINLKVTNGTAPYLYDFGTGAQGNNQISNITAGVYNVTITDAAQCKGIYTFDIGQPEQLTLAIDSVKITCFSANDGQAYTKVNGGTPDYSYVWSTNSVSDNIQRLAPSTYTVTVTDKNGCTISEAVSLGQPPKLDVLSVKVTDVICYNDKTGAIEVGGNGGRPPYRFSIDGVIFQKNTTFKNLVAGTYTIVVKDTAGCEANLPIRVEQPSPFVVNAGPDQTIELGDEANINAITLPSTNPVKNITWTPDSTLSCKNCLTPTSAPFKTTTYTIKAVDITDCPATDRITIFINKTRPIYIPNAFSPTDVNGTNDHFTVFGGRSAKVVTLMRVYDRWGNQVYEGIQLPLNDNSKGWDGSFRGQRVNSDVFTYYIVVEFIDGSLLEYRGDINIF